MVSEVRERPIPCYMCTIQTVPPRFVVSLKETIQKTYFCSWRCLDDYENFWKKEDSKPHPKDDLRIITIKRAHYLSTSKWLAGDVTLEN